MFPSIFKEITRRPEDNGKKMVSKKFINYKNHFEGGGGGGGGVGGSDYNKLIFCVKSIVGNVIHMPRTVIFLDVHEQIFLCKMSGSSLLLKLFTNPFAI